MKQNWKLAYFIAMAFAVVFWSITGIHSTCYGGEAEPTCLVDDIELLSSAQFDEVKNYMEIIATKKELRVPFGKERKLVNMVVIVDIYDSDSKKRILDSTYLTTFTN